MENNLHPADFGIIAAWDRRMQIIDDLYQRGGSYDEDGLTKAERAELDELDVLISNTPSSTARGALVQAWVAWLYLASFEQRESFLHPIVRADFDAIEALGDHLDFDHRLQFQTIRMLRRLAEDTDQAPPRAPLPCTADTFDEMAGAIRMAGAMLRGIQLSYGAPRDIAHFQEVALDAIEKGEAAIDAFNSANPINGGQ